MNDIHLPEPQQIILPAYGLSTAQVDQLLAPVNSTRISKRQGGGKTLSYLESWDVRAHLTRIFGFGNWDAEMLDYRQVGERPYKSTGDNPKDMLEVAWVARMQLTVRNYEGVEICRFTEASVGSASGPATTIFELHDNALKTAASDAFKRCAINLGDQFGLSLYDGGRETRVVRGLIEPEVFGLPVRGSDPTDAEAQANLEHSLGATPMDEGA